MPSRAERTERKSRRSPSTSSAPNLESCSERESILCTRARTLTPRDRVTNQLVSLSRKHGLSPNPGPQQTSSGIRSWNALSGGNPNWLRRLAFREGGRVFRRQLDVVDRANLHAAVRFRLSNCSRRSQESRRTFCPIGCECWSPRESWL